MTGNDLAIKYNGMKDSGIAALQNGETRVWTGWGTAAQRRTLYAVRYKMSDRVQGIVLRLRALCGLKLIEAGDGLPADYLCHVTLGQAEGAGLALVGERLNTLGFEPCFKIVMNRFAFTDSGDGLLLGEHIPNEVVERRRQWCDVVAAAGLNAMDYSEIYHSSLVRAAEIDWERIDRPALVELINEIDRELQADPLVLEYVCVSINVTAEFLGRLKTEAEIREEVAAAA